MQKAVRSTTAALSLVALGGCGNNGSEVPPELLDAIRSTENQEGTGTAVGDTVENFCFDGWMNPLAANLDPERLERICLRDFRDGGEILLVNAAAIWCTACRTEYLGSRDRLSLAEHLDLRYDRGFRILGTLFQDAESNPATVEDAVTWANQFDVEFPFALDPMFQLGAFTSPSSAPFNLLIDLGSMEILLKLEGDQPGILFAQVDSILTARAGGP